jgi:hypothetical protein
VREREHTAGCLKPSPPRPSPPDRSATKKCDARQLGSWAAGQLGSWAAGQLGSWAAGQLGGWAAGQLGARPRGALDSPQHEAQRPGVKIVNPH